MVRVCGGLWRRTWCLPLGGILALLRTNLAAITVDYVLEGPRWGTGAAGSSGGVVTWAVSSSVPAGFVAILAAAFADWTAHGNIGFQQVSTTTGANIVFADNPIDGRSNTLGTTNYSYSGPQFRSATITFDSGENWHAAGSHIVSTDNVDLFLVALHEIGHAIGLDHYNAAPAVMNAVLNPSVTDLTNSEIDGIQALYGQPRVTGAWTSLVDDAFYRAHNPDIAANGIDPATHYDRYGWHEGRDPSAAFDNELYLAHNPDVAAAGMDPLVHYLQFGRAEGRQAYAAVGRAADLGTHPGFDAEYYLLNNPDVARAAISAGGDSFAFAYQHYETNGWHEGRDPSAGFDTHAYESHYADVAAAHIDPMLHYLQNGAVEGRGAFGDGHFG